MRERARGQATAPSREIEMDRLGAREIIVSLVVRERLPYMVADKLIRVNAYLTMGPLYLKEFKTPNLVWFAIQGR